MSNTTTVLSALPTEHRDRLMRIAREVSFPVGTRIFEEGGRADRFWIIRTGSVVLDMHVPGRRAPAIETLGHNELVGWSWLFPPYVWQLGAVAQSPVRAHEFDAMAVRLMCEDDPALGAVVGQWVGRVLAHRLQSARTRLLDLYAPYGSGSGARG
ncbi:Crp/Fnr family transcriptional regulator [Streptomyces formicae]|uniref:cAMP-binding proteins-catabolite gene activator and regulatory subunit of cAMP-dependent protein kinase n=1 Tax=Streptomyces formicae TaxID=1616117 RepID=A0A291QM98_9ACTN|nr:cyclic nucleotide-binding domain-containing protein [Streptomyces formicae]ATL32565.1 cAMP-binding proteins - catabolite gene activator and regulatory subunit of cAMP-dependent protein kinase [Streptomyces formicae]